MMTIGVILTGFGLAAILFSANLVLGANRLRDAAGRIPASRDVLVNDPGTAGAWRWTVDLQQCFTYSSADSLPLIGYTPGQLLGRPVSMVLDAAELSRADRLVKETGGVRSDMPSMVVSGRHRDGSASWFEVDLLPEFDADGRLTEFRGVSRTLGPNASTVIADLQTRHRIEGIIANRLLMTAFQPIVDLSSGEVMGVEALTRFVSEPELPPDVWFAQAAGVGLGTELELLAVAVALSTAATVPAQLYISLNVSPATCLDPALLPLIDDSPLELDRIVLELTEHSPVDDYAPLIAVLAGLRSRGIKLAIDDAGAGFASLRHIMQLRPDIIKLDRCIISGIDDDPVKQALASAMVSFANHIDARVVAEGIENERELVALARLGMTAGQGFLFGRASVAPRSWSRRDPVREEWPSDVAASRPLAAVEGARLTALVPPCSIRAIQTP